MHRTSFGTSIAIGLAWFLLTIDVSCSQQTNVAASREYSALTGIPILAIVGSET